ncbi:DNA-binding protein [Spirosoma sp. KCTC 42546]|uniref:PIN domain-containing protein n=1 Tax=Spirosoma sp. KCTC 42546 TaxID=2520506 RepID=UPI00115720DF|nr:PIN domain-containing protein [Spirosoma sp. KCTC 42546]QDK78255.1 DNA-binding protein [Spirosoma sp. KCTC 42546]
MSYVIDANVLMSALISGKAFYKTIFGALDLLVPEFALVEIEKYKETIQQKSKLDEPAMRGYTLDIFQQLTILPNYFLSQGALTEADRLIGHIDAKDISYLALEIQTNSVLLTRDQPIYKAARQNGFRRIMLFDSFLRQYL